MDEDRLEYVPFDILIREATATVEKELAIEDQGWLKLGGVTYQGITAAERILAVQNSRLYFIKDPLARQAIRLWTDYTFGSGMTYAIPEENDIAKRALDDFWQGKQNRTILGAQGQRKSSDKLLVDGEIFFALFLGPNGEATIRRIDPLEITEIISDSEDVESVLYYKREWTTPQSKTQKAFLRSHTNPKGLPAKDSQGATIVTKEGSLVFHVTINTIGQRGNPLLLPAIDWIKQYRRFLASRVAIMLALSKFAWKTKVKGGTSAVASQKAVLDDKAPAAGSNWYENEGSEMTPIKTDSGAKNAYDDARLIKLQVSAAVGIPEQYWGDISTGNLATAKTVELPMLKQFQSNQQLWKDAYGVIDEAVLEHAGVAEDKRYVDRDFPSIAPDDAAELAISVQAIVQTFPDMASLPEVQSVALQSLGIDDVDKVLEKINQEEAVEGVPPGAKLKLLRAVREVKKELTNGNGKGSL